MKRKFISFIIILSILLLALPVIALEPTDISNHWAQDYIINMVQDEIMELYPDHSFRPRENITRGDFGVALARQMKLSPASEKYFIDLEDSSEKSMLLHQLGEEKIINGYPEKHFNPEQSLTQAEMITIMVRALGIRENTEKINLDNYQAFSPVPEEHWSLEQIKIAENIGLIERNNLPISPNRKVSRGEAARFLNNFSNYNGNTGYIADAYEVSKKIAINLLNGERRIYNFNEEIPMGRNNRQIDDINEINSSDKVFFVSNENNEIKYLKAYGIITTEDLTTEVSNITDGLFDSEDIVKLATGETDFLQGKLSNTAKGLLQREGLTSKEIEALFNSQWGELENLSKERLAETIAIQTGVPLSVSKSIIEGDWEQITNYAQVEAVQRIVRELLNSDLI